MKRSAIIFRLGLMACLCAACSDTMPTGSTHEVITETDAEGNERHVIVDQTGNEWDVTYAVQNYGFEAGAFQYGLGPYAIVPYTNPQFYLPEDPSYPPETETHLMVGYEQDGDSRAYPVSVMRYPEIVNDWFGDDALAVGY